jgi:hypothetical protein
VKQKRVQKRMCWRRREAKVVEVKVEVAPSPLARPCPDRYHHTVGGVRLATVFHTESSCYQGNITINAVSEYFYSGLLI